MRDTTDTTIFSIQFNPFYLHTSVISVIIKYPIYYVLIYNLFENIMYIDLLNIFKEKIIKKIDMKSRLVKKKLLRLLHFLVARA